MTRVTAPLLVLALAPVIAPAAPRLKDAADEGLFFPIAVGSRWVFVGPQGEFEEAVTEAKPDGPATVLTVVRTEAGKETWRSTFRVSRGGVELIASGGVTYEKPSPWLRTGLEPGAEWEYRYSRQETRFHVRVKFAGLESVEVPAGKFEAMRLEGAETTHPQGLGNGQANLSTTWYARGVGPVKRAWHGEATTLKSFTRGK